MPISKSSDGTGKTPVDGSGVTQPISATSLPLPTGAASESTLSAVNTKFNSLGQKTSAGSVPVVLSSDHDLIGIESQADVYAEQGIMFAAATAIISVTPSGTEAPFLLLRNPAASGKVIEIRNITEGIISTNKPTTFRFYTSPTVTANGTTITPRNKLVGNATAAVALVTYSPTVSAMGNLFDISVTVAGVFVVNHEFSLQLPAGTSILITVTPTVNNTDTTLSLDWAET